MKVGGEGGGLVADAEERAGTGRVGGAGEPGGQPLKGIVQYVLFGALMSCSRAEQGYFREAFISIAILKLLAVIALPFEFRAVFTVVELSLLVRSTRAS